MCIVAEFLRGVIYWGDLMENKRERYQKAMNIVEVMENSPFAQLMQKGLQINAINEKLKPLFPKELQGLLRFGAISQGVLFIETANAMVRQTLLFQKHSLLPQIQQHFPEIVDFNLKVNPNFNS